MFEAMFYASEIELLQRSSSDDGDAHTLVELTQEYEAATTQLRQHTA
jgi:hypothetical protein